MALNLSSPAASESRLICMSRSATSLFFIYYSYNGNGRSKSYLRLLIHRISVVEFPQGAPEKFAAERFGNFINELEPARNLVGSQPLSAVFNKLMPKEAGSPQDSAPARV